MKHIFPMIRRKWLLQNLGQENIFIHFKNGRTMEYSPSNVFHQTSSGFFRTVTFDYAHILNLYRESASKGKLQAMGLKPENLMELSKFDGYTYLQKIIALEKGKLKFDSMNQKAAAALFSEKTATGLKNLSDHAGAKCVKVISSGLSAFDESGLSSESRIQNLVNFKNFLMQKNNIFERIRRPDSRNITNELYMMTLCSIDSHIFTFLNLEFFNPRRKSTSTVEMLFGQLMMLTEGSTRLNVRQLEDVLQRVVITSSLRLLPLKVRGFQFLGHLKRHMKSYSPDDTEAGAKVTAYPKLRRGNGEVKPEDSSFDIPTKKTKRKFSDFARESSSGDDVRGFHNKF